MQYFLKSAFTLVFILIGTFILFSQERDHLYFLETDSTWRKEMFLFPISFAPNIEYQGVEDARFPAGWSDQKSPNFWSYAFAWNIEQADEITAADLEADLQIYFDGLMRWDQTKVQLKSTETGQDVIRYSGSVQTIDALFTKKTMTLKVIIEKKVCPTQEKSILLFRFSPSDFDQAVWKKLDEVKVVEAVANCGLTQAHEIHNLVQKCYDY